jgi:hypothetical protein
MDLVDYMGRMEAVISAMQLDIDALKKAVTAIPQLVIEPDPSKPSVVMPDFGTVTV